MTTSPQATTHAFARVLGPFFTIVSATVVARSADMPKLLSEFGSSAVWPWVTGAFVLLTGIVVVALHPYWRGAPAVVVSLLGWIMVVRGILLMAFPNFFMSVASKTIGAESVWRAVFVCFVAVGLFLSYAGWVARPKPEMPPGDSRATELPRAA